MRVIDVVMYLILLGVTLYTARVEKKDWECATPHSDECDGNGMPHRDSKPQKDDSCFRLVQRIEKAAGTERRSIKWRRALITSVIIMTLLYVLVITPGGLPSWPQFYISVIVGSFVLRFQFAYYSYHRFKKAEENIYEATSSLVGKGCISQS